MVARREIKEILQKFQSGQIDIDTALQRLRYLPYDNLKFARLDSHRYLRKGFPEVIFCPGKSLEQIAKIAQRMKENKEEFIATRATPEIYQLIKQYIPEVTYFPEARLIAVKKKKIIYSDKFILIISGGTSDIPVAEEAAVIAELMGNRVERLYDVGVAGLHRLFDNKEKLFSANVLIVVAGMEGALPSVVGGLVDKPIIAVPTSVGYGANFGGLSALLTMLNSCAPGLAVVNIDNGFGAGYMAGLINQLNEVKE